MTLLGFAAAGKLVAELLPAGLALNVIGGSYADIRDLRGV